MSMKRILIFVLLGPALVVASWMIFVAVAEGLVGPVPIAAALFIFTFLVAAIAGLVDGFLARVVTIPLRTLVTAAVGATTACSVAFALSGCVAPPFALLAFGSAACTGVCSLLANDYGARRHFAWS